MTDLLTDRFLRLEQVIEIAGLSKAMIYRLIREGKFPTPLKPGGTATRWRESEVREWHAAVIAARAA